MDVKSEEFFEIYKVVSDKYWDFGKDAQLDQTAAAMLVKMAERGDADQIILTAQIATEFWKMLQEKKTVAKMNFVFEDGRDFRIDVYQDGIEKEKLESLLEGAVKAMDSGNFTVNGKKNQFGKDYFKKRKK